MNQSGQFEQDVLQMLLKGDDPVLSRLREQICACANTRTESTGVGFFVYYELDSHAVPIEGKPSFSFGDVNAELEGLQFGAGFVLHIHNGLVSFLEGYSYGEQWPACVGKYKLNYSSVGRDLDTLRHTPGWPVG